MTRSTFLHELSTQAMFFCVGVNLLATQGQAGLPLYAFWILGLCAANVALTCVAYFWKEKQ